MKRKTSLLLVGLFTIFLILGSKGLISTARENDKKKISNQSTRERGSTMPAKIIKTEQEWKKLLTPEQFQVTRKKGTERAFSGEYYNTKEKGTYQCVCCENDLFSSETKYDSGSGWPSFWAPLDKINIREEQDNSLFTRRVEVLCASCNAHLGHVFTDGPPPTNLRYCINSAALNFKKEEEKNEK